MLGLEGAGAQQVEVVGLRRAECGRLDAELVGVEGGDLLIEVLGSSVARLMPSTRSRGSRRGCRISTW